MTHEAFLVVTVDKIAKSLEAMRLQMEELIGLVDQRLTQPLPAEPAEPQPKESVGAGGS